MPYVIGAVVLVILVFAFLQMGGSGGRRPRRVSHEQMHQLFNQAEGARISGKLGDAEMLYSRALNLARDGRMPVHIGESYFGLAKVQEDRGLYREAVHMVDLAIRGIEPHKADLENFHSVLTRYRAELSAKIPA